MALSNVQRFYPLGSRTLLMLILRRSLLLLLLLIILIVGIFYLFYVPKKYLEVSFYIFFGYLFIVLFSTVVTFFLGWLEYHHYEIVLGDKNLKMQRGLITIEQVGIPYRHIQDIKIDRGLLDQIVGVSSLTITTSGTEQQEIHPGDWHAGKENKIILPAIDHRIAHQIQEIVLNRAQVQQIDVASK